MSRDLYHMLTLFKLSGHAFRVILVYMIFWGKKPELTGHQACLWCLVVSGQFFLHHFWALSIGHLVIDDLHGFSAWPKEILGNYTLLSFLSIPGYSVCHLDEGTPQLMWVEAKTSKKLTGEWRKSLPPCYFSTTPNPWANETPVCSSLDRENWHSFYFSFALPQL